MPCFPLTVAEKIMRFLDDGLTGTVELHVKEGRVLAYRLTEAGRVPAGEIDNRGALAHDSDS